MARTDNFQPEPAEASANGPAPATPRPRLGRILKYGLYTLGGLFGLVLGIILLALLTVQTNWGAEKVKNLAVNQANDLFDGAELQVGELDGNFVGNLALYDVSLVKENGERLAHIDTVRAAYRLLPLLRNRLNLTDVYLGSPHISIEQGADSTWDLLSVLPSDTTAPDTAQSTLAIELDHFALRNGELEAAFYSPGRDSVLRVRNFGVVLDDLRLDDQLAVRIDTVFARVLPPGTVEGPLNLALAGSFEGERLMLDGLHLQSPNSNVSGHGLLAMPSALNDQGNDLQANDLDFTLQANPLSFQDLYAFVPALDPTGEVQVDLSVTGAESRINAVFEAAFSDGARIDLTAETTFPDEAHPAFYRATGAIRGLNPGYVTGDAAQAGLINADLDVDLTGATPEQLGGHANLTVFDTRYGEFVLDRTTLESVFTDGSGEIDLQTGLRGMNLALRGSIRPFDEEPSYDLEGRLANLNVGRFAEDDTLQSDITTRFSLNGQGLDPQTANLTARLDLEPSRIDHYLIQDGQLTAHLEDSTLAFDTRFLLPDGLIAATGSATLGEAMRYRIRQGEIQNLDVAALTGDTTRSSINATFSLDGVGTDPATMTLQADLDVQNSVYGPYELQTAGMQAELRNGRLTMEADTDFGDGGTVDFAATARPFEDVPSFSIPQAQFENLNIGALTQNPDQYSDLNGSLTLEGRGADPETMTLSALLNLTSSQLNEQPIEGAQVQADLEQGTVQYDAELTLPEGQTRLAGLAMPFSETLTYAVEEGRFSGLDLGALAGNPDLTTNLNGSLALDGVGADPKTMTLDAQLRFDRSTINDAVMEDGRVAATVQDGQAQLDARLALAEGTVQIDAGGNLLGEQPVYEANGSIEHLNLAQLTGTDTLDARFSLGFDVAGQGTDPATMRLQGNLVAREGVYGSVRLDTLLSRFRVADGLVQVDSLLLNSNIAEARAAGRIALFDTTNTATSDFRLEAHVISLEPVREMIGADLLSIQNADLNATVQGPSDQLRLNATAELNSLVYNTVRLAGFETRLDGTLGPDLNLALAEVETDLNYLSASTLTVRRTHLESAYDGNEATFLLEMDVDERRDTRFSGRVDPRPESQSIVFEAFGMRFDEDQWTLAQPSAQITYGDGYRFSDFTLRSGEQQIVVDGVIDPDGTQDFEVLIEELRLGGFADLLGLETLGGTLSTDVNLTGPASAPLLDGTLTMDLLYRSQPAGDLAVDLNYAENRLNVDALVSHPEGSTLALNGYVPMDLTLAPAEPSGETVSAPVRTGEAGGAADLRITSEAFAIDWVRPFVSEETVDDLQGTLSTDIRIGGSMDAPQLDGTFGLADVRVGLPELGVTYRDIQVDGTLQDNNVLLNRAEVHSGDGTLVAQGRVEMPELTLGEYDIEVNLSDFRAINSEEYRSTVSGDLAVSGTTEAPVVSGNLQVYNTDIYLTSTTGGDIQPVQLSPEDVRMLEETFGYRVSAQDTTVSDAYNALTLDLDVELERDTWVRQAANPEMAIEFTGQLEVQKQPNEELMLFQGIEVIPQRSYIRQFGKHFDITRGEITFNGPITEMMMDIGAQYEVRSRDNPGQPEATITLSLAGRLDDLEFTLGADPSMDYTDIVSYIATGKPAGKALQFGGDGDGGENGNLLTAGGGLAAAQLAGILEGFAGEELGLDVIEIEQDGLRGTQLVAGKYVLPQVYVGLNQPIALASTDNTTAGTTPTEITLEYQLFEWLLLQMLSGTSSSSVRLNLMGKHSF